jgi:hypothetical protein
VRREDLRRFETDWKPVRFASEVAGLRPELNVRQRWEIDGASPLVSWWRPSNGAYVLRVRADWPGDPLPENADEDYRPSRPRALTPPQVYAIGVMQKLVVVRGEWKLGKDGRPLVGKDGKPLRQPSPWAARWRNRLYIEAGLVPRPPVTLAPLPSSASPDAVAFWPVVKSLLEARRLTDEDDFDRDQHPLVAPRLAEWAGFDPDENAIRRTKDWLRRHGFIVPVGESPSAYAKPTTLWWVDEGAPASEEIIETLLRELLGAREVEA